MVMTQIKFKIQLIFMLISCTFSQDHDVCAKISSLLCRDSSGCEPPLNFRVEVNEIILRFDTEIRKMLGDEIRNDDPKMFKLMKKLYGSCIDNGEIHYRQTGCLYTGGI